jgi:glutathione synthase/RimK-type ligase-like ATP-grasp enzyme
MKINVAIFRNESADDHDQWVEACSRRNDEIAWTVLDLTSSDWLERFRERQYDLVLLRPPGRTSAFKQLYDERAIILHKYSGVPVYPSLDEVLVYENKRFLRDWLKANTIPHPETHVFYSDKEAGKHLESREKFPLVAKTNIGASGNGVTFISDRSAASEYVRKAFGPGINTRTGPKLSKGSLWKKVEKALSLKGFISKRMHEYRTTYLNPQKGFVIFQEFIPHDYEWRCVRIGDSYFAHKKIARNNKSSGTLLKGYDKVPVDLLDFIRQVTDRTGLSSVAIDLFDHEGRYLVNEVQCFFGQSDPYQMLVDSVSGRYRHIDGRWFFEAGDFASNGCYDLRLEHALSMIKS